MHLYALTRGIKHDVDRFITELQGKYLPYKMPPPNERTAALQLSVRPIQLWEFVFPKDALPDALGLIGNGQLWCGDKRDKFLNMLRLALGAKKVPKWDLAKLPKQPIYKQNVAVYPFGIKEDKNWPGAEMI